MSRLRLMSMTGERVIGAFARRIFGPDAHCTIVPLRGGLEAPGIARVLVQREERPAGSFVAKPFTGAASRELDVYRLLARSRDFGQLSPKLLGWRNTGGSSGYAFLEWVPSEERWPWRDADCSLLVVEELAVLHRSESPARYKSALGSWDYERELRESAGSTVELYRQSFLTGVRPGRRPMLRALERIVGALPRVRRELLAFSGTALLHGDVHPGNVVLTRRDTKRRPVFIDWARARIGSPLEDLASWVHSLGSWEPEARRRHDTLLHRYLAVRGSGGKLSATFREACILAGACNALAGALRYHLSVAADERSSARARFDSDRAAADWLRIVRRADLCFRA